MGSTTSPIYLSTRVALTLFSFNLNRRVECCGDPGDTPQSSSTMAATKQRNASVYAHISNRKHNRQRDQPCASGLKSGSDVSLFLIHDHNEKSPVTPRFPPASKFSRHHNPRSPPAPPVVNHITAYGQSRRASSGEPLKLASSQRPNDLRSSYTRRGSLSSAHPPPMQRRVPGPFVELEALNRGATCTTSAYQDKATGRVVCLKVCNKKAADDDKYVAGSLQREVAAYKAIAKAPSPFVLQMHGAFQDFEYVYFAFVRHNASYLISAV